MGFQPPDPSRKASRLRSVVPPWRASESEGTTDPSEKTLNSKGIVADPGLKFLKSYPGLMGEFDGKAYFVHSFDGKATNIWADVSISPPHYYVKGPNQFVKVQIRGGPLQRREGPRLEKPVSGGKAEDLSVEVSRITKPDVAQEDGDSPKELEAPLDPKTQNQEEPVKPCLSNGPKKPLFRGKNVKPCLSNGPKKPLFRGKNGERLFPSPLTRRKEVTDLMTLAHLERSNWLGIDDYYDGSSEQSGEEKDSSVEVDSVAVSKVAPVVGDLLLEAEVPLDSFTAQEGGAPGDLQRQKDVLAYEMRCKGRTDSRVPQDDNPTASSRGNFASNGEHCSGQEGQTHPLGLTDCCASQTNALTISPKEDVGPVGSTLEIASTDTSDEVESVPKGELETAEPPQADGGWKVCGVLGGRWHRSFVLRQGEETRYTVRMGVQGSYYSSDGRPYGRDSDLEPEEVVDIVRSEGVWGLHIRRRNRDPLPEGAEIFKVPSRSEVRARFCRGRIYKDIPDDDCEEAHSLIEGCIRDFLADWEQYGGDPRGRTDHPLYVCYEEDLVRDVNGRITGVLSDSEDIGEDPESYEGSVNYEFPETDRNEGSDHYEFEDEDKYLDSDGNDYRSHYRDGDKYFGRDRDPVWGDYNDAWYPSKDKPIIEGVNPPKAGPDSSDLPTDFCGVREHRESAGLDLIGLCDDEKEVETQDTFEYRRDARDFVTAPSRNNSRRSHLADKKWRANDFAITPYRGVDRKVGQGEPTPNASHDGSADDEQDDYDDDWDPVEGYYKRRNSTRPRAHLFATSNQFEANDNMFPELGEPQKKESLNGGLTKLQASEDVRADHISFIDYREEGPGESEEDKILQYQNDAEKRLHLHYTSGTQIYEFGSRGLAQFEEDKEYCRVKGKTAGVHLYSKGGSRKTRAQDLLQGCDNLDIYLKGKKGRVVGDKSLSPGHYVKSVTVQKHGGLLSKETLFGSPPRSRQSSQGNASLFSLPSPELQEHRVLKYLPTKGRPTKGKGKKNPTRNQKALFNLPEGVQVPEEQEHHVWRRVQKKKGKSRWQKPSFKE